MHSVLHDAQACACWQKALVQQTQDLYLHTFLCHLKSMSSLGQLLTGFCKPSFHLSHSPELLLMSSLRVASTRLHQINPHRLQGQVGTPVQMVTPEI